MNRTLARSSVLLLGLLAVLPTGPMTAPLAAQETQAPAKPTRKSGTIFKAEIDQLVDGLRQHARQQGNAPLGGASLVASAQVLTAMANCHRRYHVSDGPVVKPTLNAFFQSRGADGSFGAGDTMEKAQATAWIADALAAIDPDGTRTEVDAARTWLARNKQEVPSWGSLVRTTLESVRADWYPQDIGKSYAQAANELLGKQPFDATAAVPLLVQLVACQVANRELDKATQPAAAPWSDAQQKAFDWLLAQQEGGIFSFQMGAQKFPDPGFTSLGLQALLTKPAAVRTKKESDVLEQGLRWLLSQQNEDGSFGKQNTNYVTCVAVGALARWEAVEVKPALLRAQSYILAIQNVERNGYQRADRDYGSIGYGGDQRGDLSNLQFALEALRVSGLPADHEAFAKAMVFLHRTQNLKSVNEFSGKVPDDEGNLIQVTSGDDGGSAYYPGNSPMGYVDLPDGTKLPRSYGSMTYALLKSYTLAGVRGDDPRVQAAVRWLQSNWTLEENPGADPRLGEKARWQGWYYYFMVMAQALDAAGIADLRTTDKDGKESVLDWRKELRTFLVAQQQADGSWRNQKNDRWYEGIEVIGTCYAMLALEKCR
ncbi:MAG: hypothetical protein RL148_1886 [Planctomycetota bacterium]